MISKNWLDTKKLVYLSVFAVLLTILSFSTTEAHATNFVLTQAVCSVSFRGTWNSGNNTCTVSTLTLNSTDVLAINSGTTLTARTSFTNFANITLNTGNLVSSGTLSNSGNVTNSGGSITNSGALTNNVNSIINNNSGGKMNNTGTGTISNSGNVTNNGGSITNSGALTNNVNSTINNNSGGTMNNTGTGTISNSGFIIINPSSIMANVGTINNNSAGNLTNNAANMTNSGKISNSGIIGNNGGTISSSGILSNNVNALLSNNISGYIANTGNLTNSGTIKNNVGTIDNFNNFTNNSVGLIENPATIVEECHGFFTNNGKLTGNAVQDVCGPPIVTSNIFGTLGKNNWYTSNVNVTWTVIAPPKTTLEIGCSSTLINTDTTGQTLTCSATDANGTTSNSTTIMRDTVPPSISVNSAIDGHSNPVTNGSKTNSTSITISFTPTDVTSGVASSSCKKDVDAFSTCSSPVSYSSLTAGSHTAQIRSNDTAGNVNSTIFTWKVDIATPIANPQSVTASINAATPITLTGSDPDGDSVTYTVKLGPSHGVLSGTAPNLTYTPNAGYHGSDSFTFTTTDGTNTSAAATVSITVIDKTSTTILPNPSAEALNSPITFSVNVVDTTSSPTSPTSTVSWNDGGALGHFSSSSCTLTSSSVSTSTCNITYTPAKNGLITITGTYAGDGSHLTSSSTSILRVSPSCSPPISGDWTVSSSCFLSTTFNAPANVIVQSGAVLTVPSGVTLHINLATHHLIVKSGGGVLIKSGGKLN